MFEPGEVRREGDVRQGVIVAGEPLVRGKRLFHLVEEQMAEKERIYGERYPIDEDFLSALAVMPPASGVALGFDRLVMLATGATRIEQVLWTPMSEH